MAAAVNTITGYNKKNNIAAVNSAEKIQEVLAGTVPEICRAPGGNLHIKWQYDVISGMLRIPPEDVRICDLLNRQPVYLRDLADCSAASGNVRINDVCFK